MRNQLLGVATLSALLLAPQTVSAGDCSASSCGAKEKPTRVIRIGAVAYAPGAVTVFEGIRRYFDCNGLPVDYVLYSNYDALVTALEKGQVDIAWNTPLAHARYHLKAGNASQTLVMRDVDCNFRSMLIVRADAKIGSLDDLKGKTLILGSWQAAEATILPIHFLKHEGLKLSQVKLHNLDAQVDLRGNPCSSEIHVLRASRRDVGRPASSANDFGTGCQRNSPIRSAD